MDKKFISGTVFGLVVGIVVSIATPMLGAKDIVISSPKKQSTSKKNTNPTTEMDSISNNGMSQEAVQLLKEINSNLKENTEQNKEIIQQLSNLNKKQGI
jgi:gas vesicle protein